MEIDEYALTKACKVYHDAKGQWADMTIRKCVEAYLEHSYKHTAEKQLADTMRENERLRAAVIDLVATFEIIENLLPSEKDALQGARKSLEQPNKDSDNG